LDLYRCRIPNRKIFESLEIHPVENSIFRGYKVGEIDSSAQTLKKILRPDAVRRFSLENEALRGNVLIVEDNEGTAEMLMQILQIAGFGVGNVAIREEGLVAQCRA